MSTIDWNPILLVAAGAAAGQLSGLVKLWTDRSERKRERLEHVAEQAFAALDGLERWMLELTAAAAGLEPLPTAAWTAKLEAVTSIYVPKLRPAAISIGAAAGAYAVAVGRYYRALEEDGDEDGPHDAERVKTRTALIREVYSFRDELAAHLANLA